ncbi:secretin N-terminal domain-containing protein [Mucisphaera calidilacus]|uniref:Type II secretion system protein D n=1 Tax=Mucisphaera calidilacus TaxID=2527982 RepID=A0A518BUD5_9BACT|nr:secretin N-terminal domain-containing protein [Mucisphaera calidilacus]QDU70605.1 Putative type II secretion system protein D precursor [Mucisphaera calidilacus]
MNVRIRLPLVMGIVVLLIAAAPLSAQNRDDEMPDTRMVTLNFPGTVDLKVLIDYVSKREGINFIYDQNTVRREVTINAPEPIPASSLMTLLESVLRMNNLALVESDIPNTIRIEANRPLRNISVLPDDGQPRATQAVTRVFTLDHATAQTVVQSIKPFLSATQADITPIPESDLLIVTDFASNMDRLERLIFLIDQPQRQGVIEFVDIEHVKARDLADSASKLLSGLRGPVTQGVPRPVTLQADEPTNRIAVVGEIDQVKRAVELIRSMDRSRQLETKVYALVNVSPDRIDTLMTELLDEVASINYRAVIDSDANALIVTATNAIHEQIESLRQSLDISRPDQQSPIRFYTLQNASVKEVLDTLTNIEGNNAGSAISIDGVSTAETTRAASEFASVSGPTEEEVNRRPAANDSSGLSGIAIADEELGLDKVRILGHEETNTIIVIARPAMHEVYERLIKRLDIRQPQVLLEATVVAIDTTDGFQLGVEILVDGGIGDEGRSLTFSSFGLSQDVDAANPALVLEPGVGFNGAVLSPNVADVVVRALQSDDHVKVVSRPTLLVTNNENGELVSLSQEPFSSVNASSTVSTTSFGGYSDAGTTIRVTPQISEGDQIKLSYGVELSSFTVAAETDTDSDELPPAKQTNSLNSVALLPDGYTMIVGGLTRDTTREEIDSIPLLGDIPGLKYFFSNRVITKQQSTLFVFIKAVILRDDKFEYLKYLSGQSAAQAGISLGYPESEPVIIP